MDTCFGLYGTTLDVRNSCLYGTLFVRNFFHNPRFDESWVGYKKN